MMVKCLLIAGEIGAGKTTIAELLAHIEGGEVVRVRQALVEVLGLRNPDRKTLQEEGAALDQRTNGAWLVDFLFERLAGSIVLVDSMRTERQTLPVLNHVPDAHLVYLQASVSTRRRRFSEAAANDPVKRFTSFERAMQHPTEQEVQKLRTIAEVVLETDEMTPEEVVSEVQRTLRLSGGKG